MNANNTLFSSFRLACAGALSALVLLQGCAVHSGAKNPEAGVRSDFYVPAKRSKKDVRQDAVEADDLLSRNQSLARNVECLTGVTAFDKTQRNFWIDQPLPTSMRSAGASRITTGMNRRLLPLSPGDKLEILIHEGEEFSGQYLVNHDGTLELPYLPPIVVSEIGRAHV